MNCIEKLFKICKVYMHYSRDKFLSSTEKKNNNQMLWGGGGGGHH